MPYSSSWIRKDKRLAIYLRDEFTCAYCGRDLHGACPRQVTLDHLQCRHDKGGNDASNLVTACLSCNSSRKRKAWREYATGGAIERIEGLIRRPLNLELARAIIAGTAGDPEVEAES